MRFIDILPFALIAVFVLFKSMKILKDNERAMILRLGKTGEQVRGPGRIFVFYPVECMIKVNLDDNLPYWRSMSQEEISRKLIELLEQNKIKLPGKGTGLNQEVFPK